ncbi:MAG: DUF2177 family protein [Chlamydiia bacterium]
MFFSAYFVCLLALLLMDGIWLGVMGKRFYAPQLEHLMAKEVVWWAAALFYLIYALGLTSLIIYPLVFTAGCPVKALWMGALFGLTAYATYDLTNLATLNGWPIRVVVVDLIWGTFLSGLTSAISFLLVSYLR